MAITNTEEKFEHVGSSGTFNRMLDIFGLRTKRVLDLGCGSGEFLVKFGPGSVGVTTVVEEVEYGKARGINIVQGNAEKLDESIVGKEKFDVIWANNLFEHLLEPHGFLIRLRRVTSENGLLLLGVPVIPRIASLMKVSRFRGALAVSHSNFFTRESLRLTVVRGGWKVQDIRPFKFSNVFIDRLYSFFAPHLYVVARLDPNFKYPGKKVKEWQGHELYSELLSIVEKG